MRILLAVMDDLFRFAVTSLSVFFRQHATRTMLTSRIAPAQMQLPRPSYQTGSMPASQTSNYNSNTAGMLYFIGSEDAELHTDPVMAFDVVVCNIPYGEQVRLLKLGGRWGYIRYKDEEGWVLKDVLREQARDVFPVFEEHVFYNAEHEESRKLRLCIHDEFCGDRASLPLTDAEYVTYKLHRKDHVLPWASERPRTPGTWHTQLRGKNGVHVGIVPMTDTIMEYGVDDVGYVCFVDAVFPDESIKISGIGLHEDGVYSEHMLSKEAWKEFRPIFIEV